MSSPESEAERPPWESPKAPSPGPPSLASLLRLLPLFRQQLEDAEARAQRAMGEAESLRQVVRGLEGLAGQRPPKQSPLFLSQEPTQPEPEGPRGQEAVRQVMATSPEQAWPLAAITAEVMKRGWIDPNAKVPGAAIRAATQRLAAAGMAEKVGAGRYRLTPRGREGPDG